MSIIRHPSYSPDSALSDFSLFNLIKNRLDNHTSVESQKKAMTSILEKIPQKEYKKTFNKWIERMQFCIKEEGRYFKHLIK